MNFYVRQLTARVSLSITDFTLPFTNAGEETQEVSQTLQSDVSLRAVELSKSGLIGLVQSYDPKPEFYDKACQTEHQSGDSLSSEEDYDGDKEEILQGGGENESR